MRNKIVSFGDSFIFGTELTDNARGDQAWPALAARRLGVGYETRARPGCGNENITQQIFTYFAENPADDVVAVINWTWAARWDFYIAESEQWVTLGQTCVPSKLTHLVDANEAQRIIEFYQDYPGNSSTWEKFRSLQTIYSAQQYLESLNVPCVQTYMDYDIWDQRWQSNAYIQNLQNLTCPALLDFEGKNFLDWSRAHGFDVTEPAWHPLEDAHDAACDLWVNVYAQKLK
jgi:hypothetical protein